MLQCKLLSVSLLFVIFCMYHNIFKIQETKIKMEPSFKIWVSKRFGVITTIIKLTPRTGYILMTLFERKLTPQVLLRALPANCNFKSPFIFYEYYIIDVRCCKYYYYIFFDYLYSRVDTFHYFTKAKQRKNTFTSGHQVASMHHL